MGAVCMEEKINGLYQSLRVISDNFLNYEKRNDMLPVQECMSQMQEFVIWFLEVNRFEVEDQVYEQLKRKLLSILTDILDAIERKDCVLLHDAVAFGFMAFLELFTGEQSEEKIDDDL